MQLFQPLIIINVDLLQVRMSVSIADGGLSRVSKGCPEPCPPCPYSLWPIEYQLKADVLMLAQLHST